MKHLKTYKLYEGSIKNISIKIENGELLTKDEFEVAKEAGYKGKKIGNKYRVLNKQLKMNLENKSNGLLEDLWIEPKPPHRNLNKELQDFIDKWIPEYAGEDIMNGYVKQDGSIVVRSVDGTKSSKETWEANAEDMLTALYDEGWGGYTIVFTTAYGFNLDKN